MDAKKQYKYFKKKIEFNGSTLVMFSIDGDTWSTRKEELVEIIERHELQKQNFGGQIKGGPQVKTIKPEAKARPKKLRRIAPVSARNAENEEENVSAAEATPAPEKSAVKEKKVASSSSAKASKKSGEETKKVAKKTTTKKSATKTKSKAKKAASKPAAKSKSKTKSKVKAKAASSKKIAEPKSRATARPKRKSTKSKQKSA